MKKIDRKSIFANIRRIVVKVGTSSITSLDTKLDLGKIGNLVKDLVQVKSSGKEVVLVTSGAIATGMGKLGWKKRPDTIPGKQAAAAVGQTHLMRIYELVFGEYDQLVAQILLTQGDINDRKRYINASNTISTLLQANVIPIVNENDTVAVDEIKVGDNDTLSAHLINLIKADLLIILSDVDGFYDNSGKVIDVIPAITPEIKAMAGGEGSAVSTGGMITKLKAAEIVTNAGEIMVIANSQKPNIVSRILNGENEGTIFLPKGDKLPSRKRWIASTHHKGTIKVDSGAKDALIKHGRSLLPSGIIEVVGDFEFGDTVRCVDEENVEFAKGLTNYSSVEVNLIKGKKTNEIESILGQIYYDEVIHRDNLVLIGNQ
ncbi:TPA: glutamate 5-kinase [Candidatus Poribacteria bacterium]|nr:glutamate 5-kinase [Candidatus Poribacteria bacterium]